MAIISPRKNSDELSISPSFRVIFWNCRGAVGKKAEIEKLCEEYEVVVLAETCFSTKFEFYVRGFHCLRSDCFEPGKRGVAMLIKNKIKFKTVDIPSLPDPSLEVVAVEIRVEIGRAHV